MRLKNSEKKLLLLLVTALALGGFFNYVFFPIYDVYSVLSSEKLSLDNTYKAAQSSELSDAQLKIMLKDAYDRYELLKIKMPIYSHQEDAILQLTQLSKQHLLNVEQYQFQYSETDEMKNNADAEKDLVEAAPISDVLKEFSKLVKGDTSANVEQYKESINPEGEGEGTEKAGTEKSPMEEDLNYLNVSMQLSGKYTDFKAFLTDIENYKNTIIITQINVAKDPEKLDHILGTVAISYPYFTDNEDIAPSTAVFKTSPKSIDPFSYTVSTLKTVPNTSNTNDKAIGEGNLPIAPEALIPLTPKAPNVTSNASDLIQNSDFHMNLKPLASDAPTTTIGQSLYRYSELYSTVAGQEILTMTLIKKEGQYYYRYANSKEKYPNGADYLPIVPWSSDKFIFAIQSEGRLPSADQSGVMLQISNNTDLPLELHVFGDDKKNPRFKYKRVSGTIKLIKE